MQLGKKNRLTLIAFAVVAALILSGVYLSFAGKKARLREFSRTGFYMDTYVEIKIIGFDKDENKIAGAMGDSFAVFEDLQKKFNFYESDNFLSGVNDKISSPIDDKELLYLLKMSLEYAQKSDGAFDPTLGALKEIYPIGKENPIPPGDGTVKAALKLAGYKKVSLRENVLQKPAGLKIDLGGVLKGYAVEKAAQNLASAGIENFIVNGGGNIRAKGVNLQGEPWRIGIENPRKTSEVIGVITLEDKAVATSGDYQRYFFYKGRRYHHILDGRTGEPAGKAILATVIAPDALTADIMSTAAFVKGRKEGVKFLEQNGLEGLIMDENAYSITKGLKGKIKIEDNFTLPLLFSR